MAYELFCQSVRGASHIRKDIPCQDFGMKKDCGEYKIFATADGHGDPRCIRSDIGSRKICEIAHEDLETFARTVREQGWEDKLFRQPEVERLVRQLVHCMVGKWIEAVGEEYENHPLTEAEKQRCGAGSRVEKLYGTTLIAGLQTEKYLLLLQQGDGRCVVFYNDGSADQPIPWDDSCVGNATTSLCDIDAAQRFRSHVIDLKKTPVIACIAGTDGVEDSFPSSMEKTHAYYRGLLRYACEKGVPALEEYLAKDLCDLSTNGSADDVTVSGIVDVERVSDFLDKFEKEDRRVELEDKVAALESKLNSIREGGKLQHLENEYKRAESWEQEAQMRCKEAYLQNQEAESSLEEAKRNEKRIKENYENMLVEFDNKKKQYHAKNEEYEEKKKQRKEEWEKNLKENISKMQFKSSDEIGILKAKCKKLQEEKDDLSIEIGRIEIRLRYAKRKWDEASEKASAEEKSSQLAKKKYEPAREELDRAAKKKLDAQSEYESYKKRYEEIQQDWNDAKEELENFRKSKI